jgi:hypothetical protein
MKQHFSEADLLETYYTQPGESMPVMMHLADCSECAERYERLGRKLRGTAVCHDEKPETFWARQRISILRRIAKQQDRRPRVAGIAAAAALTLVLGGLATWRVVDDSMSRRVAVNAPVTQTAQLDTPTTRQLDTPTTLSDPWQSEELEDFQSMVAWESWVDASAAGDQSL